MVLQADLFEHLDIIVELYPPLFICMVMSTIVFVADLCFSLSIVLVMCSVYVTFQNIPLFSYLSFCDCHLFLSVCQFQFDCHLQKGSSSSYLRCASCMSNYCPSSTHIQYKSITFIHTQDAPESIMLKV